LNTSMAARPLSASQAPCNRGVREPSSRARARTLRRLHQDQNRSPWRRPCGGPATRGCPATFATGGNSTLKELPFPGVPTHHDDTLVTAHDTGRTAARPSPRPMNFVEKKGSKNPGLGGLVHAAAVVVDLEEDVFFPGGNTAASGFKPEITVAPPPGHPVRTAITPSWLPIASAALSVRFMNTWLDLSGIRFRPRAVRRPGPGAGADLLGNRTVEPEGPIFRGHSPTGSGARSENLPLPDKRAFGG